MGSPFSSFYYHSTAPGRPAVFAPAFMEALDHGVVAGVFMPGTPDPVPEPVLSELPLEEQAHAAGLRGYRQMDWVGGRLALRHIFNHMGLRSGPILSSPEGAPLIPKGFTASISHKRELAVAMAARGGHGTIGIDLEDLAPAREGIAARVLCPQEFAEVDALPEERRWTATVIRFSIKEAIYKAIHPHVRRYVGFEEAEVYPDRDGTAQVTLRLKNGEGPFQVEARYYWLPGQVLSSVRIQPAAPGRRGS